MLGYEGNISQLQRWILNKAYCGIMEAGSDEPQELRRADSSPPVHLLRIEVLRDYFGIPLRTQKNDYGHKWLVIDNLTAGPKKANAARTSLSRSLKRRRVSEIERGRAKRSMGSRAGLHDRRGLGPLLLQLYRSSFGRSDSSGGVGGCRRVLRQS
jgi:hypothetical protein